MALSYGSSIVRDGLFLHYDFANIKTYSGTGNTIYDLSGNNKNATKGQYRFFTNQSGGELVGQGISGSDPLSISGIFGNYYTSDLTASMWVKFQRCTEQDIMRQYVSVSLGWLVTVNANNQIYLNGRDGVSDYFVSTPSTTTIKQGIVYNIVFTKSGNLWKLFINGEEEISNFLGVSTNINSNASLIVGTGEGFPHSLFDFKMYSRALSSQEVEQNYNATKGRFITEIDSDLIIDLNPNDTRSYSGSGTSFIDISANSNTALMINGPIFGSDGYTNYWKFDGVNDYASVSATPTVFDYNRNSFTISCWAWYDVLESPIYKSGLLSKWQVGGGTNNEFLFIVNGSSSTNNYYYMQLDYDDGLSADYGNNATITSTSKVNLKFWRLATFTFDNGVLKMYIDGNLETTLVTPNTKVRRDTSSYLEIARWYQASPIYGSGRRGQIQFYNRALTSTEILNLFNLQRQKYRLLNPSYMKNCVFNFDFGIEGTFDNSGTTVNDLARYNHGTTFNSPTFTFENRGAMVFNGTNQYIRIPNDSVFNHTSGYFSYTLWVNFSNVTGQRWLFSNYAGSTTGWVIQLFNGVIIASFSGDGIDIFGTTLIQANTWYHLTVTCSPGSIKLYINGIKEGNTFTGSVSLAGGYVYVAALNGGYALAGKIALIQMFNAQLSEADVKSHYAETLPRFTTSEKPVRGLIFDVNVSNSFSYNGASNDTGANLSDISGNGYVGTLSNAPSYNVQNGIKSLSFNGSNNYITYPTAGLPYGASARTISVWLNPSSLSNGWAISYGNATATQSNFIGIFSGVINYGGYSNDVSGPAPSINTWYHVVGIYDGTTAYMYINGYLYTSLARTWNTVQVSFQLGRQTHGGEYWNGKIGEAQIYNRALSATEIVALYNSTKGAYGF